MRALVVYHSADLDGLASGASLRRFIDNNKIQATFKGWDYGNDTEFLFGHWDVIYAADISFPPRVMQDLRNKLRPNNFIWIDHHKSAILDSVKYGYDDLYGLRKEGMGACELVWEYFETHAPLAVKLLSAYDVFDKDRFDWNNEVLPYQYAIRSLGYGYFDIFQEVIHSCHAEISEQISIGKGILAYEKIRMRDEKGSVFVTNFEGINFLGKIGHRGSMNFDCFPPFVQDTEAMMIIRHTPKDSDNPFKISLYGWEGSDLDLSVIAKEYGGGGHPRACGFPATLEMVNNLICK